MGWERAAIKSFSMPTTTIPRRHSLRIPAQPPPIPIPPSLRESPYLNATLFKYDLSLPRSPSDEDERWLQDTVPLAQGGTITKGTSVDLNRRGSIVRRSRQPGRHTTPSPTTNSRSSEGAVTLPPPPSPSPPIVHWRASTVTRSNNFLSQTRSEPNVTSSSTS